MKKLSTQRRRTGYETMRILVTGASGQLGHDVVLELSKRKHCVVCGMHKKHIPCSLCDDKLIYIDFDITDENKTLEVLITIMPDVVIHCAAWTNVDMAEKPENFEKVNLINVIGTRNIARACKEIDSKLLYISTDYVFDGSGDLPWSPDCSAFNPLNHYGMSKLQGEIEVISALDKMFIVRVEWLYGLYGHNFMKTMLSLSHTVQEVKVVNDQIGTPTFTVDLAKILVDMVETEQYGFYHISNSNGWISWYDVARELYSQLNITTEIVPIKSSEYTAAIAKRPLNSRLDCIKLQQCGFDLLPDWRKSLSVFLEHHLLNFKRDL